MEKEKFYKLLTSFIISLIGMGFLFHLMFDNFSHEVNFNFSESVTQYSSSPKVNDLYIWEDSAVDQKKYFRVSAVSDTIGVIEMVTNSTKQVDEITASWLSEATTEVLTDTINKDASSFILNQFEAKNARLKIYRQQDTTRLLAFIKFLFSGLGFITLIVLSFLFSWFMQGMPSEISKYFHFLVFAILVFLFINDINSSVYPVSVYPVSMLSLLLPVGLALLVISCLICIGYEETIDSFHEKYVRFLYLVYLVLFCCFITPFEFGHWLLTLFFSLLSVVPIYFLFPKLRKTPFFSGDYSSSDFLTVQQNKTLLLFAFGAILQILAFFLVNYIASTIFQYNIVHSTQFYFKPIINPLAMFWLYLGMGYQLNNFRKYFVYLQQKEIDLKDAKFKELESQAQLNALQARINPHFLYNSLNSIAGLAQEDPVKTEEMAIALSHFYKYSTNRKTEHWNTIEEEIEMLQTYLDIEKIRFGERLQFSILCADDIQKQRIPRFLLQPLLENAIKYGYQAATNSITIRLEINRDKKRLLLRIYDKGSPFSENIQTGYGLQSVRKKLALLYPTKYELAFINEPEKHVSIILELS